MHSSARLDFSLVNPALERAADPTCCFAFLHRFHQQVNETLSVRSAGFRSNGLDSAATPVGSERRTGSGHLRGAESVAESKHHMQEQQKWCTFFKESDNRASQGPVWHCSVTSYKAQIHFPYFLRHIQFSKLTFSERLLQ